MAHDAAVGTGAGALMVATVGILGAAVGSFLNVVAYRLPRGESLVAPRSRCPACEAPIAPHDNVPVLSWLLLRGRCRACGASISVRYPLVEALTAAVFAAVAVVRGVDSRLALELPFAAMLIAVASIDLERKVIPNKILLPAAVYGVACAALVATGELPELLIAGAAAFLALLLIALAYPAGMGMGDVKLAGVMGLYLGSAVAPALLVAFLAGTLVGLGVMLQQGAGARKKGVPFGPFLAVGGVVGLLAGPELVDLYLDSFVR
jgi:leader peptidase (prepilin peptidase)/N-methyltransferase